MTKPLTIAITGMNALPHNPGPGVMVARCIREAPAFKGRIIGLGYDALDPGLYLSQYCDNAYLLPYPHFGERALLERIRVIHQQEKIDILISCLDAELLGIVRLQPELEALGLRMLLPTHEQIILRNKEHLPELAQKIGVFSPALLPIRNPHFFDTCYEQGWSYPCVVKGLFYDAQVVFCAEEGKTAFKKMAAEWGLPILVQQYITGDEINLTAIGDGQGNMIAPVMMKKRGISDKGKAWAGISIQDDGLRSLADRFAEETKWRGPLEIEVMRDKEKYYLIEINPRFPAWIYLSVGVSRNLPALLIQMILGKKIPTFPEVTPGVSFIRYAEETIVTLSNFKTVAIHGTRNTYGTV